MNEARDYLIGMPVYFCIDPDGCIVDGSMVEAFGGNWMTWKQPSEYQRLRSPQVRTIREFFNGEVMAHVLHKPVQSANLL